MTAQSRDAAGVFHVTVTYPTADLCCVLEASTNLVQWTKVQVRTHTPPAAMEFTGIHATTQPARFYRVGDRRSKPPGHGPDGQGRRKRDRVSASNRGRILLSCVPFH